MCDEKLQDLEDYIQYQFDDIPSFKLAIFLNSGEIKAKTVVGEVEENFITSLISSLKTSPTKFHVGNHDFSLCSGTQKLSKYHSETTSPRIYTSTKNENCLIVYCCGTTLERDEKRVEELMTDLLY